MRGAIAFMLVCALLSGCSKRPYLDANLELMNAERRGLEDRLYDLEYEYEATIEKLDRYRRENEELKRKLGRDVGEGESAFPELEFDQEDLGIPRIEVPDLDGSAETSPEPTTAAPLPLLAAGIGQSEVTHIDVNPRQLGGVDFDEQPGDDGLAIVVEPKNEADKLVRAAGPIRVVVLDYALRSQGSRAVVAQWSLTKTEVTRFLEDSPDNQGIQLHLLWPEAPPEHGRLRVNVRYTTADGRHLDTRRDVIVDLPPKLSTRWTPRAQGSAAESSVVEQNGSPAVEVSSKPAPADRPEWKPYR